MSLDADQLKQSNMEPHQPSRNYKLHLTKDIRTNDERNQHLEERFGNRMSTLQLSTSQLEPTTSLKNQNSKHDKTMTQTKELDSIVQMSYPVNIRNVDLLKDCCKESDPSIDTHLNHCCQLLSAFRLSQSSASSESVSSAIESIDARLERDKVAVEGEIVELSDVTVVSKNRKTTKRNDRRNKKNCRRGNNSELINLDITVKDKEPAEGLKVVTRHASSKQKKVNVKNLIQTARERVWKGLRVSCKFLWSGLILHAKPFGELDTKSATVWDEKEDCGNRQCSYPSDLSGIDTQKSNEKLFNHGS